MITKDFRQGFLYITFSLSLQIILKENIRLKRGIEMTDCDFCGKENANYKDNDGIYCNPRCATQDCKRQLGIPYFGKYKGLIGVKK